MQLVGSCDQSICMNTISFALVHDIFDYTGVMQPTSLSLCMSFSQPLNLNPAWRRRFSWSFDLTYLTTWFEPANFFFLSLLYEQVLVNKFLFFLSHFLYTYNPTWIWIYLGEHIFMIIWFIIGARHDLANIYIWPLKSKVLGCRLLKI